MPACARSMPCEGKDTSNKTQCETSASVNKSKEASCVDKQARKEARKEEDRIQARKEARIQARK